MPMPTTVAVGRQERDDIFKFALAQSALARRHLSRVIPFIDSQSSALEKVQHLPAIGTRVPLYKGAQDVSLLLFDRRKILTIR